MRGLGYLLAVVLLAGCGESGPVPPRTIPVKGRVVYPDGTPLKGGLVAFTNTADASLSPFGDIGPSGEFTLRTIFGSKKLTGAPEGTYQVTIRPPPGPEKSVDLSVTLPEPVQVKAGQANELTLTYSDR